LHVAVPGGVSALDLSFQHLSSVSGAVEITDDLVTFTWSRTLLYPAGWYARNIPVRASVMLPEEFRSASSLDPEGSDGQVTRFTSISRREPPSQSRQVS